MRLTRQSEIAIDILAACATAPHRQRTIEVVARTVGATKAHTARVVTILVHGGYLATARGRAGGLSLAQPPETIGLGEVLLHTQPRFVSMVEGRPAESGSAGGCFSAIVEAGKGAFIHFMNSFSIADLVDGRAAGFGPTPASPLRKAIPATARNPVKSSSALSALAALASAARPDNSRKERQSDYDTHLPR